MLAAAQSPRLNLASLLSVLSTKRPHPVMDGHGAEDAAHEVGAQVTGPVVAQLLQLPPSDARRPKDLPRPRTLGYTPCHP